MDGIENIKEIQKQRFQFLHRLYELSQGSIHHWENMFSIGQKLGLDRQSTSNVTDYLINEGLIKLKSRWFGGLIEITHAGIKEVEEALTHPDRETQHFLPVNIIQVDTMIGSQIQQASPGATQVVTIDADEKEKLEEIIQSLKEQLDDLGLNQQEKNDLNTEISTIESQMSSSKPSRGILKEALAKIPNILAKATATVLATDLINQITTWLGL